MQAPFLCAAALLLAAFVSPGPPVAAAPVGAVVAVTSLQDGQVARPGGGRIQASRGSAAGARGGGHVQAPFAQQGGVPPGGQPATGTPPAGSEGGAPPPAGAPVRAQPALPRAAASADAVQPHPWSVWWELNRPTYVATKRRVLTGGITPDSAEYFLGLGVRDARAADAREVALAPLEASIVPALLAELTRTGGPEATVESLLALGRVSPVLRPDAFAPVEQALVAHADGGGNRAVVEAALLALGFAEQDSVVPYLARVVADERGIARARAMAAYALALNARATRREDVRRFAVGTLWRTFETADRAEPDLPIACLLGIAIVPLDRLVVSDPGGVPEPPSVSRVAAMRHLGAQFGSRRNVRHEVRAHMALALGRLAEDLPDERCEDLKPWAAEPLLSRAASSRREGPDVTRAVARALGAVADSDADPLDERLRAALLELVDDPDVGTRYEALLALGRVAGRPGHGSLQAQASEALGKRLIQELERGRGQSRPFAATALAIAIRGLKDAGRIPPAAWSAALARVLADARSPEEHVAGAVAIGIARESAHAALVQSAFQRVPAGWERAQVALALGMLEDSASRTLLREFAASASQNPRDLAAAAQALVLAGDAEHARELAAALGTASANRARAIAYALGLAGDPVGIEPLVEILRSPLASVQTRAAASRSLGRLADRRTVSVLEVLATHAVPTVAPSALFGREALASAFDESPWPSPLLLGGGILNLVP